MNDEPLHLYLLKRKDKEIGYDEMAGCVVASGRPLHARDLAAGIAGDEGGDTWQAPSRTSCTLLAEAPALAVAGIILRDFRAG